MSVQISLDPQSLAHLNRQFEALKRMGPRSLYSALHKVAFKIKTESQMRLRGQRHIVTSRLRNSIFVKTKAVQQVAYTDNLGDSYTAELPSVAIGDMEMAIGTNVIYAGKIEDSDSYLNWALNNVNVERSIQEDMQDAMKFGTGVIPTRAPVAP